MRVLIADDDPAMRETLVEMLQPEFETIDVESGAEAVEVVEHGEIHLVILDVHMPLLSGIEALRQVRLVRFELPCILLSANWTLPLREEALSCHASAVLEKPVSRRELVTTISSALDDAYPELWSPDSP